MTAQTEVSGPRAHNGGSLQLWIGRTLSGLAAVFLLWDGTMKFLKPEFVIKATRELGYQESDIVGIGALMPQS